MNYFDCAYFDQTYFSTDCPPAATGGGKPGRGTARLVPPSPVLIEDEELLWIT